MDGIICDRCGRTLLVEHEVRYVAEVKVYAAYDPMEVTREDLQRAGDPEVWDRLLEQVRARSAEELEDEVCKLFRFDLCPPCQKVYLQTPLPPVPDAAVEAQVPTEPEPGPSAGADPDPLESEP
jgi:hypothetical protein